MVSKSHSYRWGDWLVLVKKDKLVEVITITNLNTNIKFSFEKDKRTVNISYPDYENGEDISSYLPNEFIKQVVREFDF